MYNLTDPAGVRSYLSTTSYAAREGDEIARISGGFANFTYRVPVNTAAPSNPNRSQNDTGQSNLGQSDASPRSTVVLKHAAPYLATSRDFALDVMRSHIEASALRYLGGVFAERERKGGGKDGDGGEGDTEDGGGKEGAEGVTTTIPRLLLEDEEKHVMLLSDVGEESVTLKAFLLSTTTSSPSTSSSATTTSSTSPTSSAFYESLGISLASFLTTLHSLPPPLSPPPLPSSSLSSSSSSPSTFAADLHFAVTFGRLAGTVARFPTQLETYAGVFRDVEAYMRKLLLSPPKDKKGKNAKERKKSAKERKKNVKERKTFVHGDFWPGNVLVLGARKRDGADGEEVEEKGKATGGAVQMTVVDWELSRIVSSPFADVAQMAAELWLLAHCRGCEAARVMLGAFLRRVMEARMAKRKEAERKEAGQKQAGLGCAEEEFVRNVLIALGTHLVVWTPRVEGWGERDAVAEVVGLGARFVGLAWGREWTALQGGDLGVLVEGLVERSSEAIGGGNSTQ